MTLRKVKWKDHKKTYFVKSDDWYDETYDQMMLYDKDGTHYRYSRNDTPTMNEKYGYFWVYRKDLKET